MGDTAGRLSPASLTQRARGWGSRRFGNRSTVAADLRAGAVLGLESVPDGLLAQLPRPVGTDTRGVAVLRLRAKEELGSTVVKVLITYAEQLTARGEPSAHHGIRRRARRGCRVAGIRLTSPTASYLYGSPHLPGGSAGTARMPVARRVEPAPDS